MSRRASARPGPRAVPPTGDARPDGRARDSRRSGFAPGGPASLPHREYFHARRLAGRLTGEPVETGSG